MLPVPVIVPAMAVVDDPTSVVPVTVLLVRVTFPVVVLNRTPPLPLGAVVVPTKLLNVPEAKVMLPLLVELRFKVSVPSTVAELTVMFLPVVRLMVPLLLPRLETVMAALVPTVATLALVARRRVRVRSPLSLVKSTWATSSLVPDSP